MVSEQELARIKREAVKDLFHELEMPFRQRKLALKKGKGNQMVFKKRKKRYKRQVKHTRTSKKGKRFRAGTLRKDDRKVFRLLSKRKNEVGGYMDFNKSGLENVDLYFGTKNRIEIPNKDYEVDWHTHPHDNDPYVNALNHLPSAEDLQEFLFESGDQQTMVIFKGGNAVTLAKTSRTKQLLKSKTEVEVLEMIADLEFDLQELVVKKTPLLFKMQIPKLKSKYARFGLKFKFAPAGHKTLRIPITVKEPRRKTK